MVQAGSCPQCGAPLAPDTVFCGSCGALAASPGTPPPPPPPPPAPPPPPPAGQPKKNNIIIIGALVAVAVLIAGVVFHTKDDDKSATITTESTVVATTTTLAEGVLDPTTLGDDAGSGSDTVTTDSAGSSIPDSQPVTVTGDTLPAFEQPDGDTAVGMDAPLLSGLDFQSDPVVIDPAAEGPYMLVFLAHWCPHCNAEMPLLIDWKNSGGVPAELNVVGIATAVSSASANYPPHEWFADKGWSWPVLVDESQGDGAAGVAAQAYGATGWPYFVIVGADGKVKVRVSGEVEVNDLQQIVDDALAG